jgi:hypothetical protein
MAVGVFVGGLGVESLDVQDISQTTGPPPPPHRRARTGSGWSLTDGFHDG